jgi:hypothetical protein
MIHSCGANGDSRTFLDVLGRSARSTLVLHMLSILLSITAPWRVTSWTRAKRLGAIFLDVLGSLRLASNDS